MHIQQFFRACLLLGTASIVGCSAGSTGGTTPVPQGADFSFSTPTANAQVTENQLATLSLVWKEGGSAISNEKVSFTTTQGSLVGEDGTSGITATATTSTEGVASVQLVGTTGGDVTVTASATDPATGDALTATVPLTFVGPPANLAATAPTPISSSSTSLITATVTDQSSTGLEKVPVTFDLPDGGGTLSVKSQNTDSNGVARSVFTPDGTLNSVEVDVSEPLLGTKKVIITIGQATDKLSFSGCPATVPSTGTVSCTISLVDSNGKGLSGQQISLTATLGSFVPQTGATLASSEVVNTGNDGNATFSYRASNPQSVGIQGSETLSASVTPTGDQDPITQTLDMTVDPASFSFTSPAANAQAVEDVNTALKFSWTENGKAVTSSTVQLVTSAGVLVDHASSYGSTLNEATDSSGNISVDLLTNSSSGSIGTTLTVTATATDKTSGAQMSATLPMLQVGAPFSFSTNRPSTIAPGASSLITVIVYDSAGTKLIGIPVHFAIDNHSGMGTIASSATTGSNGQAQAIYQATGDHSGTTVTIDVTVPPLTSQQVQIPIGT